MNPSEILKRYWGFDSFRPLQESIIQSVLEGEDTLALLPTGGGKSVCFQVPVMVMNGIGIVVSPLIALMKDQVDQLQKKGIKAAAIYSGMSKREIDITLDNCIYGDYKFLYVSPERLKTELFLERARKMTICLVAIDEAHCVSQWGYDFRPPYLEIASFKEAMGSPRLIALTATATREVKKDIIEKLAMKAPKVYQKSFARANLSYSAFKLENKEGKLMEILGNVAGSSVVYVRSRKRTREISELLSRHQISSDYYHAGLSGKERAEKQAAWLSGQTRVIVATNAFGMGIDKPDVRTVVHLDLPDTLEAYYQEAGRAGRDGLRAFAVAVYHPQDSDELLVRTAQSVVSMEAIKRTYQALANYFKMAIGSHAYASFQFNYEQFIRTYNLSPTETYGALKKLTDEGLIQMTEGFYEQSKITFLLDKSETYKFQIANPKLDALVKTLLRLYGGEVFSGYSKIKERDIGSLLKSDMKQVKQWLSFLHDNGVIDYQRAVDTPTITFLTPRQEPEKLPIDTQQIEWRRKLAIEKANAVLEYLTTDQCRTQVLQRYFDEEPNLTCGICDNDLERKKKLNAGELPIDAIQEALEAPRNLSEIRALLARYTEDQIMEALRVLINDKKVIESEGKFALV